MKKKLVFAALYLCMTQVFSGGVSQVVAFGDSLSDTGNLYEYMNRKLPMSPPYYKGRFTSGPVWVEHLVRHYYQDNALEHLSVYAFGGAGIDAEEEDEEEPLDGSMLTLKAQVESYLLAHQSKASPNHLYTIWMGSNNYLGLPEAPNQEVDLVISGIKESALRLKDAGAKYVMIIGLPDLGRTPLAAEFESQEELTYLTHQHNKRLANEVKVLQAEYPEVTWIYFEMNDLFIKALTYPEQYNYKNTSGTCYDTIDYALSPSQPILNMVARVQPKTMAVHNTEDVCSAFLFFDPVHPAGKAHKFIAEYAIDLIEKNGIFFQ